MQDLDAIGPALDQYVAAFNRIVDQCQHGDTAGALATAAQVGVYGNEIQARATKAQSRMMTIAW